MKNLLVAVNAKYIHTCLAARCLVRYVDRPDTGMLECTINESIESVTASVYRQAPEAVLFPCYIWNIDFVLAVADDIKKIMPQVQVVLGGPQVSFDAAEILRAYPFVDAVIRGEGEQTLKQWLEQGKNASGIAGMTHRDAAGTIVEEEDRPLICDLDSLPFAWTQEDIEQNKNKLIYYESSRGCPFRCSYCLSSTVHSVRFRSLEKVKEELLFFVRHGVRIVKFVDRTFNADRKRTYELLEFLTEYGGETTFHFEVAADLLTPEQIGLLQAAPKGRFQLEIGVQSTNEETLEAIDRKTNLLKIEQAVRALEKNKNVHLHLDLIAGLPYEDFPSFKRSFDQVLSWRPEVLQLGFLKVLPGTKIKSQCNEFQYRYTSRPPFEILKNQFISYGELQVLKRVEAALERYYNSGVFAYAMRALLAKWDSPFALFDSIGMYFEQKHYDTIGISRKQLYQILSEFDPDPVLRDFLKLDYFLDQPSAPTPSWSLVPYDPALNRKRFELLDGDPLQQQLPEYVGKPIKETVKHLHFERFCYDVLGDGEQKAHILVFDSLYGKVAVLDGGI